MLQTGDHRPHCVKHQLRTRAQGFWLAQIDCLRGHHSLYRQQVTV